MRRKLVAFFNVICSQLEWFAHCLRLALRLPRNIKKSKSDQTEKDHLGKKAGKSPGKSLRIVAFTHNLNREGAPISLYELLDELRRNHHVDVSLVSFKDGPLRYDYELSDIPVRVEPVTFFWMSRHRLENLVENKIAMKLTEQQPDLVLANTLMCFPAILAADTAATPSVWIPRESEPWREVFNMLPPSVAEKAVSAIDLPARVVFVSETTRRVWRDFETANRFQVINNALNLERFKPFLNADKLFLRKTLSWQDDEVVILLVGTLCERKGQADLLDALRLAITEIRQTIRVVLVGDEVRAYGTALREAAESLNKRNPRIRFDFRPSTGQIGPMYGSADIFVMCSRFESYPRAILEAMAFGLAIITTRVFGISEQLTGIGDACFYDPGDHQTLATQLVQLVSDPVQRTRLGSTAKRRYAAFPSYGEMANAYASVIRDAVS
jgi:glycosyltransferase involved in cell wall biosynthesis